MGMKPLSVLILYAAALAGVAAFGSVTYNISKARPSICSANGAKVTDRVRVVVSTDPLLVSNKRGCYIYIPVDGPPPEIGEWLSVRGVIKNGELEGTYSRTYLDYDSVSSPRLRKRLLRIEEPLQETAPGYYAITNLSLRVDALDVQAINYALQDGGVVYAIIEWGEGMVHSMTFVNETEFNEAMNARYNTRPYTR
ncbi:hypothetical protein AVV41_gp060 [Microcystis phage MaMV-DC]|uniref:Uncharacterized protein n=1 Tax=Microcystis phage MaMV-DC TaxID=1357715 RepID=A0A075BUT3_9CAUD|nr:hypothetical protein AVV41_gp060 [Microcystis phage MaMV-DC]AGR48625.1 hypothetical protein MaMVDC_60 [Microcystis phage MaMV-DC]